MEIKKTQQNPNPRKLCFQAFYWATGKIVQINATGLYDSIAFLSSLWELLRACSVKYLSDTGKNKKREVDYADFESKINLFLLTGLKAICRFPGALLPSTFIGRVKKDANK